MTISEMLSQSGILTLLGMGVVFSFLIILILSIGLLRIFVRAFHLDKDLEKSGTSASSRPASAGTAPSVPSSPVAADNGAVVAAIAAAIKERESL